MKSKEILQTFYTLYDKGLFNIALKGDKYFIVNNGYGEHNYLS